VNTEINIHPGIPLKYIFIDILRFNRFTLANLLEIHPCTLDRIISGKYRITTRGSLSNDMALKIVNLVKSNNLYLKFADIHYPYSQLVEVDYWMNINKTYYGKDKKGETN
jgi:plasmid maintenance system antidote protein VapI